MIKMPDRKFFSLFFLVLFLGMKSLSYHPLAHMAEEDQFSCELCEAVVIQEYTPLQFTQEAEVIDLPAFLETPVVLIQGTDPIVSVVGSYYCRPPPST